VTVAVKIVEAVRTADSAAPLVINLSLGAETLDDQPLLAVEVALEIAHELHPDCLAVAAAGNSGSTRPCFPAASRDVVAVAALDADLQPTAWTNRGFWVDCAVVGEGILSTYVPGHESLLADSSPETWDAPDPWALWSGTSFAAPQVAAAVARRAAEVGCTTREALGWLFAQSPRVPDVGRVLRLLRGTPVT
jgi:subtilisin family serine protease